MEEMQKAKIGGVFPPLDDLESIASRLHCCAALMNEVNTGLGDMSANISAVANLSDAYIGVHDLLCSIRADLCGIIDEAGARR